MNWETIGQSTSHSLERIQVPTTIVNSNDPLPKINIPQSPVRDTTDVDKFNRRRLSFDVRVCAPDYNQSSVQFQLNNIEPIITNLQTKGPSKFQIQRTKRSSTVLMPQHGDINDMENLVHSNSDFIKINKEPVGDFIPLNKSRTNSKFTVNILTNVPQQPYEVHDLIQF